MTLKDLFTGFFQDWVNQLQELVNQLESSGYQLSLRALWYGDYNDTFQPPDDEISLEPTALRRFYRTPNFQDTPTELQTIADLLEYPYIARLDTTGPNAVVTKKPREELARATATPTNGPKAEYGYWWIHDPKQPFGWHTKIYIGDSEITCKVAEEGKYRNATPYDAFFPKCVPQLLEAGINPTERAAYLAVFDQQGNLIDLGKV